MRSITGTTTCLGQGPMQRRAQWSGYKPPRSGLSTPVVNKSSHRGIDSCSAKKPPIFKDFTPYLSHNPATFWLYVRIESSEVCGGCGRLSIRERRSSMNPSLFPYGRETSKDLHTINVRDPGQVFGLRIPNKRCVCGAPCSPKFVPRGRNRGCWMSRSLVAC